MTRIEARGHAMLHGPWYLRVASVCAALILSSCGGTRAVALPVVQLAHSTISHQEYNQYVRYSERYYSGLGEVAGGGAAFRCTASRATAACRRLRQQVLARLIEEHVVLDFARLHHLRLSPAEQARAAKETQTLVAAAGAGSWPFPSRAASNSFLRQVVTRELLIRQVEQQVVPKSLTYGLMFHIRKFDLPPATSPDSKILYRQAVDLATDGKPVPAGSRIRSEWITPFRVERTMKQALLDARPGQYTGPFATGSSYQVVQLLGKAFRTYGLPARQTLDLRYFRAWLRHAAAAERPTCFTDNGHKMACPAKND